ncbi:polyphosphate kinase [Yersinia enterocolitica]|nr:polyphosphate kinase [Yersinia enterocolitica]HDL6679128.1 polyphosphate kinase [Yersinia enterocolitica]HDL8233201.1 polyphosphate kinase [Yersinia enterocolitica]HDX8416938.1 polyphosphate kinase [Yersinia enterocolitica]HEN3359005.1 polyphosphate kinase [Yersinia enterocolitica]
MHMPSKNKQEYPTEITDKQLRYLITAFENNMAEFYPIGREAEIARQLLSLREQNLSLSRQLDVMTAAAQALRDQMYKGDAKLTAITAAKPKALPRHIYSMLVNELRDVPAIGCKREFIVGVLNRHGVIAEPVQCDPPATE